MKQALLLAASLAGASLLAGCGDSPREATGPAPNAAADVPFQAENQAWRNARVEALLQPDGWTSLAGLHWLELKAHYVGSGTAIGNGVRFAFGPPRMGMVARDAQGAWWFTPEPGVALTYDGAPLRGKVALHSDHDATPSTIGFDDGKGQLTLLLRGNRHALRIKHADAPTRQQFAGLHYWPADAAWRVRARFLPHPLGKTLPIADIVGTNTDSPNPGAVEFERDGKTYRLEAIGEPGRDLFFVFADRTSGHGSYPAGRFLEASWPNAQGDVLLDFNRAYNPPCAFTLFATCPLPPPENRIDLAVSAGEKTYSALLH